MNAFKAALYIGVILQSSCATATRGSHERVKIVSEPHGATVSSDFLMPKPIIFEDGTQSEYMGCAPTPCSLNISRRAAPVITVSKPGFQSIKFKIVSTWQSGASALRAGSLIAGIPPGSHVKAGEAGALNSIPVNGGVLTSGLLTYGVGPVVDIASGANRSLSPNPVSVYLAPLENKEAAK